MSGDTILSVESIDVFYGASKILFGVDLAVERGRTLALLGRNGAGKSTTLKAIAGIARPRSGRINLSGTDLSGARPDVIARAGVGYVPEDRQVFAMHSVEDNLMIGTKRGVRGRKSEDPHPCRPRLRGRCSTRSIRCHSEPGERIGRRLFQNREP